MQKITERNSLEVWFRGKDFDVCGDHLNCRLQAVQRLFEVANQVFSRLQARG